MLIYHPVRRRHEEPCHADLQLLGLRGPEATSEPQVQAAVEELGRSELEDGYSPRAIEGRLLVLQEAAEGVRHARNHPGMEPRQLEVEWALLPGTLALLQEVRSSPSCW